MAVLSGEELQLQTFDDGRRDLVLDGEDVFDGAVELLRPELEAALRVGGG